MQLCRNLVQLAALYLMKAQAHDSVHAQCSTYIHFDVCPRGQCVSGSWKTITPVPVSAYAISFASYVPQKINSCTILNFGQVYNVGSETGALYKVTKDIYDTCSSSVSGQISGPGTEKITTLDVDNPAETVYTFDENAKEGWHYFTTGDHMEVGYGAGGEEECRRGQRLKVEVVHHGTGEGLFAVQTTSGTTSGTTSASCYSPTTNSLYRAISSNSGSYVVIEQVSGVDGSIIWSKTLTGSPSVKGETAVVDMKCNDDIVYVLGRSQGTGYLCSIDGCNANDAREAWVLRMSGADGTIQGSPKLLKAIGEDYPSALAVDSEKGYIYLLVTHSNSHGKFLNDVGIARHDLDPFQEWLYKLNWTSLSVLYLRKITTKQGTDGEKSNARSIVTKSLMGPIDYQGESFLFVGVDTAGELSPIIPQVPYHDRFASGVVQRLNVNYVEGQTPSNEYGLRLMPGNPDLTDVENLRDFISGFCWDNTNRQLMVFGSTTGSMGKGGNGNTVPSGSLEENAGELDAFLCTIDPTLSSNYQCAQFGSVGNDFASSCAVVSNSAYLLGTAESGPVNGFGEKWFGGKDLFTRTFDSKTLNATNGQQFGTPFEEFSSDEWSSSGAIYVHPSGNGFLFVSTNGALVKGVSSSRRLVTNPDNVLNPVVSKIFGDGNGIVLPSTLGGSESPNSSTQGSGISTASIVCMAIFIPIGVALFMYGGYAFGKRRTERKYSNMAEKYGDVELGGMTVASMSQDSAAPAGQKAMFDENERSPSKVMSGESPPRDTLFTPDPITTMHDIDLSSNAPSVEPYPPPALPPTPAAAPIIDTVPPVTSVITTEQPSAPFPPQSAVAPTIVPDPSSFSISDFEDAEGGVTSAAEII
ncbi:hypothetical protein TrST_g11275 [Triparma strigata]|uniref:Uncharacterized protein n=1 Tax=Triparma strigata TaxID=1606541 RepID=A0A9W7A3T3_9STRA|nr:hypothetical protein TrST_g11275 [Triparma strigata]